jgi:hypothetical protein
MVDNKIPLDQTIKIDFKICKTCKQLLPTSEYHKDPKSKDRLFYSCKKCCNAYRKKLRANRPKTEEQIKIHREKNKLHYKRNKEKKAIYVKKRRLEYPEIYRGLAYKYKYGILMEDYKKLLVEQDNCCAICKISQNEINYNLVVDHCHISNNVRGLLCRNCNLSLGYFKDNINTIKNSIIYLNKYK